MIKIILTGFAGEMGKNLVEIIENTEGLMISAGIDRNSVAAYSFPQFTSFSQEHIEGDVIIDFSHHSVIASMLDFIEKTQTPAVICTTGINEADEKRIHELSSKVALFKSGNMSLGINLILELAKRATEILEGGFDIEIVEKHHNRKVDAPSGTALMIANAINETLDHRMVYQNGRSGNNCKRQPNEIGIHALRGGTIVGEHSVVFAGLDEIIEIKHSASSRKVFAKGAVNAARFLYQQPPGLYDMKRMLG